MRLKDLKKDMICVCADDSVIIIYIDNTGRLFFVEDDEVAYLEECYEDDLSNKFNTEYDIVKVYQGKEESDFKFMDSDDISATSIAKNLDIVRLINKAKCLGYDKYSFKSIKSVGYFIEGFYWNNNLKSLYYSGGCCYSDGKWAEIIKPKDKEIWCVTGERYTYLFQYREVDNNINTYYYYYTWIDEKGHIKKSSNNICSNIITENKYIKMLREATAEEKRRFINTIEQEYNVIYNPNTLSFEEKSSSFTVPNNIGLAQFSDDHGIIHDNRILITHKDTFLVGTTACYTTMCAPKLVMCRYKELKKGDIFILAKDINNLDDTSIYNLKLEDKAVYWDTTKDYPIMYDTNYITAHDFLLYKIV